MSSEKELLASDIIDQLEEIFGKGPIEPHMAYLERNEEGWYCNNCNMNSKPIREDAIPYIKDKLNGVETRVSGEKTQYLCDQSDCPYMKALVSLQIYGPK